MMILTSGLFGCVVSSASCHASAFSAQVSARLGPCIRPLETFLGPLDKNAIAHSSFITHSSFFSFLPHKRTATLFSVALSACVRIVHIEASGIRVSTRHLQTSALPFFFTPVSLPLEQPRTTRGSGRYTIRLLSLPCLLISNDGSRFYSSVSIPEQS